MLLYVFFLFFKKFIIITVFIYNILYIIVLDIYYDCICVYGIIYFSIKENMIF
jgi:hypothetical protein